MVKALHRAGIEVILDVVFNHTAEGDHRGPTLCFRGIDNNTYYILEGTATVCQLHRLRNTLNANHPIVRRMIVDSLRYWVEEMHVDGLSLTWRRFWRGTHRGEPFPDPPVLWDIESEPALAGQNPCRSVGPPGCIRWGESSGTPGKNGTAAFATTSVDFFRGEPGSLRNMADRLWGAPRYTATRSGRRNRA